MAYAEKDITTKLEEGVRQIQEKKYANWHFFTSNAVEAIAFVIDHTTRTIVKYTHLHMKKEDVLSAEEVSPLD